MEYLYLGMDCIIIGLQLSMLRMLITIKKSVGRLML